MPAGDVPISDELAYDGAVFAFDQCIVLAAAGPALAEFDEKAVQQFLYGMVDKLINSDPLSL
jgi:hypothetical protein